MGSLVSAVAGPILNTVGGLIGGGKASQAANQQATAFRDAATWGRNAAAFQPFGITTGFGSSNFGIDPTTGRVTSAGYTLSPQLQGVQNQIANQFGSYNLNPDVSQITSAANQAFGAGGQLYNRGQGLFDVGQSYLMSPAQAEADYMARTGAALAPERERARAATANQVFRTGRTGLATGGTTTGMLQSNPEFAALYNAQAQQDLNRATQAQAEGRKNVELGANLYGQGSTLFGNAMAQNRGGVGFLNAVPEYQAAVYSPLRTALGMYSDVEKLGMQPYEMSTALGRTIADAGVRQGELYMGGERAAAPSSMAYSSYSPWAQTFQGAGQALSGMSGSGGGSTSNWFDNLLTANRYNTNVGSQQTRMLAEQDRGLF